MSDEPKRKSSGIRDYIRAEAMVQLAISIPAGCLVGWLLGAWLDRHFHQGWIAIAGVVLGAVAGFVQMLTTAARYMKDGQ